MTTDDTASTPGPEPRHFREEAMLGATFDQVDLTGATLNRVDLTGSRLTRIDFTDASLQSVSFTRTDLRDIDLTGTRIRGAYLTDVEIDGEVGGLRVNGVEVAPLIEAELDRLHPERTLLRPTTAAGFREAWEVIDGLWGQTIERARRAVTEDPDVLHASVDGEWSFIETLRHLAFATSCWLSRAIQGEPAPWHPWELPCDDMSPMPGVPQDRTIRPTLDQALDLRRDRFERVRAHLASMTDDDLAATTTAPSGPGWPPGGREFPVKECLTTLINEEWWHRQFAERDLAVLEALDTPETLTTATTREER